VPFGGSVRAVDDEPHAATPAVAEHSAAVSSMTTAMRVRLAPANDFIASFLQVPATRSRAHS
jgi:hypothetical protein